MANGMVDHRFEEPIFHQSHLHHSAPLNINTGAGQLVHACRGGRSGLLFTRRVLNLLLFNS